MSLLDTKGLLQSRPLFAVLSEQGLARLAEAARLVSLVRGQILFSQGDPSDAAYVVVEGRVAVGTVSESGQDVHFADLPPGTVFGEIAVLDRGPRTASVTAVEDSRLLRLPGDAFMAVARTEPDFAIALLRDVVAKLRSADTQIEDRSVLSLDERLAKFLRAIGEGNTAAMTQAQIAERLGVSREAVNRRLRVIVEDGAIKLGRGRITLVDESAL